MLRRQVTALGAAATASVEQQWATRGGSGPVGGAPQPLEEIPVYLKPSRSGRRRSSFYIPRMRELEPDAQAYRVKDLGSAAPLFAITSASCEYFALRLPLLKAGFKRLPLTGGDVHTACNVVWGKSPRYARRPGTAGHIVYSHTPTAAAAAAPVEPAMPPASTVYCNTIALNQSCQKFNHYPGSHKNLGCKRGLAQNIMRAEGVLREQASRNETAAKAMYAFSPRTWFYPENREEMIEAFRAAPPSSHFIWKPARGSCGRGILLSQGGAAHERSWHVVMKEIEEKAAATDLYGRMYKQYVVQEYVENPLLLEGRKMDLRLYVTVTSYNPLTVYLHEEGLVRLAVEPYHGSTGSAPALHTSASVVPHECAPGTQGDAPPPVQDPLHVLVGDVGSARGGAAAERFRHLTNFSVGRRHHVFQQTPQAAFPADDTRTPTVAPPAEPVPELKWSLDRLWSYVDAHHGGGGKESTKRPSDTVRERVALLITRTLLAARPNLVRAEMQAGTKCGYFELYGFDVMLDEKLNPFLIEINTLPSLESSSDFDYATKCNVVSDMLNLAMIEPFARDAATLQPFTTNPALLQLPAPSLKGLVRGIGESAFTLDGLSPAEQEAEIRAKLDDELLYARGFKRIFPPVLPSEKHAGFPLTADSRAAQADLAAYASFGMLTTLDHMALT